MLYLCCFFMPYIVFRHLFKFQKCHDNGHDCRNKVRNRSCVNASVDSHKNRKNQQQRHKENNLPCKRQKDTFCRLSDGGKEGRRNRLQGV